MPRKLARFTAAFVVAPWLFWISPIGVEAWARPSPRPDVQQLIDRIKASHSSEQQEKLAFRLWRDVKLGFFEHYSDREIDQISDLLNSEDDVVVLWSAWALAAIGPKARRAAPVLQQAELKWQGYYCANPALPTRHTLGAVVGAMLDLHIELANTHCQPRPGPSAGPAQAH